MMSFVVEISDSTPCFHGSLRLFKDKHFQLRLDILPKGMSK